MHFGGAISIVLVALCCIYIVTSQPYEQQRIVGGSLATVSQYPSIAALLYSYNLVTYTQSCGGTIITTKSILTAAHCVTGDQPAQWRVRVGSSFSNSGGVIHTASSLVVHSAFNSRNNDNDVAILRLTNTVNYTSVVAQASIAGSNYNLNDNQVVWAAGWGSTSFGGPTSEQLRHVQIWSINQATCKGRYAYLNLNVTDNMLCSGWLDVGGRDQCQGDSGGPLYHNGIVVGICSWGAQCALPYYPGVNTRVSRFTSWIQNNA